MGKKRYDEDNKDLDTKTTKAKVQKIDKEVLKSYTIMQESEGINIYTKPVDHNRYELSLSHNTAMLQDREVNKILEDSLIHVLSKTDLRELNLEPNSVKDYNFSEEGLKAIAQAMTNNTTLKTLTIKYLNLNHDQLAVLTTAIGKNTTIETVAFSSCNLTDEDATIIICALQGNNSITALYLNNNEITGSSFAKGLAHTNIHTLDLNYNPMEANTIAELIQTKSGLSTLSAEDTDTTNSDAIIDALIKNFALLELTLVGNSIDIMNLSCIESLTNLNALYAEDTANFLLKNYKLFQQGCNNVNELTKTPITFSTKFKSGINYQELSVCTVYFSLFNKANEHYIENFLRKNLELDKKSFDSFILKVEKFYQDKFFQLAGICKIFNDGTTFPSPIFGEIAKYLLISDVNHKKSEAEVSEEGVFADITIDSIIDLIGSDGV